MIFINFQALDIKFDLAIKPKTFEARGLSFWNLASFLFMGSQQSPFNISNSSSDKEKITKLYHDKYWWIFIKLHPWMFDIATVIT